MQRPNTTTRSSSLPLLGAALLACAAAAACADSSVNGIIFESQDTTVSVVGSSIVRVSERWILWQADENTTGPTGTDLNGDGDKLDLVATVVEMASKKETNLGVAVQDLAILGTGTGAQLLLVVDEAGDGFDWNGDGDTLDLVLLDVPGLTVATATPTLVATLSSGDASLLVVGERAYFVEDPSAGVALAAGETAIDWVEYDGAGGLTAPVRVLHQIADPTGTALVDVLSAPHLVAIDGELLLFTMDETVEEPVGGGGPGVNLNGGFATSTAPALDDADMLDTNVLGVLDTTDPGALALNLSLAVPSASVPVRVIATGTEAEPDKLLAFLVSETDQNATNLNTAGPPASPDLPGGWEPSQCDTPDTDTVDNVLFYLTWEAWLADPLADRAKNTGLAGHDRVLALENGVKRFVATLSLETDAECDLNFDGDTDDDVFRYAPVGSGTSFVTADVALLAIAGVAGNAQGVSDLNERFLAVISEEDNNVELNGDVMGDPGYLANDLIGWLNPGVVTNSTTKPWIFDHNGNVNSPPGYMGTDWFTEREQRDYLLTTVQELTWGASLNARDSDEDDVVASYTRFDKKDPDDLDFFFAPVAVRAANAGAVLSDNDIGFLRVDEAADGFDWNGDGDTDDQVLFRTTVPSMKNSNYLGVLNVIQRPAVELGGTIGAAYLADEAMAGRDYNEDGDMTDLVLRWFRIG